MAVLDGGVTETLFHFPEEQAAPGMLVPKSAARLCARNQVAFITDEIALHEIAAAGGAPAVSLHLYSRPFSTCQVYERETGRVAVRQLSPLRARGAMPAEGCGTPWDLGLQNCQGACGPPVGAVGAIPALATTVLIKSF